MNEAYWGVLGLTPTEDERVIRKAYLSLLPGVHPEEDPDGFRALREAYEFALESARQNDLLDGDDEPQATIEDPELIDAQRWMDQDRKSTRLNSSHVRISYAVFCLKK